MPRIACAISPESSKPNPTPTLVSNSPSRSSNRITERRSAPSAIRMPISRVRSVIDHVRLLLRDRLGCRDALNLDGGPSTQLVARLGGLRTEVPGGWGVPNALIALPGS